MDTVRLLRLMEGGGIAVFVDVGPSIDNPEVARVNACSIAADVVHHHALRYFAPV